MVTTAPNTIKRVQPIHGGRTLIGIQNGYNGAKHHIKDSSAQAKYEYSKLQLGIAWDEYHAHQANGNERVPNLHEELGPPPVHKRSRRHYSEAETGKCQGGQALPA